MRVDGELRAVLEWRVSASIEKKLRLGSQAEDPHCGPRPPKCPATPIYPAGV